MRNYFLEDPVHPNGGITVGCKDDHTKKHMYITPWIETGKKDTLEKVIAEIGVWCKKAKPKQITLF